MEIVDNSASGATFDGNYCEQINFEVVCSKNGGDGLEVGDVRRSDLRVLAFDNGGYGINKINYFFSYYGNGNRNGLIRRRSNSINLFNSVAQNGGDPSTSGRWNTRSDIAYRLGAVIYDTTNDAWYLPLGPAATNNWFQLSGTAK